MSRLLGRYQLEHRLAEGGMAEVWLATAHGEAGFTRRVAIKQLFAPADDGGAFARMFLDEARITSRLHHASIVAIVDFGIEAGRPFQVLELIDGFDSARLERWGRAAGAPLSVGLALHVCAVVGHALHFAHVAADEAGAPLNIVHRDVSPQNVLISRSGDVKLSDFGIAFAEGRAEKTVGGVSRGKPAYMAPEQAVRGAMDGRTDVFALGCVLHALATGESALRDENALVDLLAGQELSLHPQLPEAVRAIVARATRRNRAERFESAEAMALACSQLLPAFLTEEPRVALRAWVKAVAPASGLGAVKATPRHGGAQSAEGAALLDGGAQHTTGATPRDGDAQIMQGAALLAGAAQNVTGATPGEGRARSVEGAGLLDGSAQNVTGATPSSGAAPTVAAESPPVGAIQRADAGAAGVSVAQRSGAQPSGWRLAIGTLLVAGLLAVGWLGAAARSHAPDAPASAAQLPPATAEAADRGQDQRRGALATTEAGGPGSGVIGEGVATAGEGAPEQPLNAGAQVLERSQGTQSQRGEEPGTRTAGARRSQGVGSSLVQPAPPSAGRAAGAAPPTAGRSLGAQPQGAGEALPTGVFAIGGEVLLGGEVFIDGQARGFAPARFELPVGSHRVEVLARDGTRHGPRDVQVTRQHTQSTALQWQE